MPHDSANTLKAGQRLAKMALATSKHPTRQVEMLLELDARLLA
jgi:hypothetical protein